MTQTGGQADTGILFPAFGLEENLEFLNAGGTVEQKTRDHYATGTIALPDDEKSCGRFHQKWLETVNLKLRTPLN